jgi:hypothetical protein
MGRWWSPPEPRSVELLLLGVALVVASFYAGTLFQSSASPAVVLPPSGSRSPDSSNPQGTSPLPTPGAQNAPLFPDPLLDRDYQFSSLQLARRL